MILMQWQNTGYEVNALIKKNQLKEYGSRRILTEFSKINCKREGLDTAENIWKTGSTDQRYESGRPNHARTEENVTTVDELGGLLSQEDQPQTHRSTRQISTEKGLTQSSVIQVTHRDLDLKCLFRLPTRLLLIIVSFLHSYFTR